MLVGRLNQIRQRSLKGVIRPQNINVNHRLESINRKLVDRSKEIARSTGTEAIKSVRHIQLRRETGWGEHT